MSFWGPEGRANRGVACGGAYTAPGAELTAAIIRGSDFHNKSAPMRGIYVGILIVATSKHRAQAPRPSE